MERISVRRGKNPILFVAPHGPDDQNTEIIAETAAESCDGYYVINRGFERSDYVDVDKDKANCNRIDHALEDVVKEEFLDPITKFTNEMKQKLYGVFHFPQHNDYSNIHKPLIFYVHGAGDHVHKVAGERVSVIVGYGLSKKKDSITCENWRRAAFVKYYRNTTKNGEVYEGKGGGNYGGRSANNMNQYFRKYNYDKLIDSMQLEFPYSTRCTESIATLIGFELATVVDGILNHDPSVKIKTTQCFI